MQIINPYKLFTGAFIPNWLLERKEVSPSAKLCYARLCQYAGRGGECYPKQKTLAEELGVSRRQVIRYLEELKALNLIATEQLGSQSSNKYIFLWHPWMSVTNMSTHPCVKSDTSHVSSMTPPTVLRESMKKELIAGTTIKDIISHYIKTKNWEDTIKSNKKLYSDIYKRNIRAAKTLFSLAGSLEEAHATIDYVAEKSKQQKGWEWTLETVCKKIVEYKSEKEQKPEGAAGRML